MSQLRRQVKMSPSSPFHLFHSPIIGRGKGAQKVKKNLALLLKREMSFWESQNLQESRAELWKVVKLLWALFGNTRQKTKNWTVSVKKIWCSLLLAA